MNRPFVILLLLIACSLKSLYADSIEIIELENRPAAELIPILKPMLDSSGSITGTGFQLMVRTSEQNLEQIRQLVRKLDSAPKQLLISVFQGSDRDLRALGVRGGFQVEGDDSGIRAGEAGTSGAGGSIQYSTRGASAGASTLSTRARLTDNPIHQLRVTEGSEGYIETGESIPYFSGGVWLGRHPVGAAVGGAAGGMDYKDIHTGFYVLARIHGEQVTMEVSPYKQSRSQTHGASIDTQRAATRVTGAIGQWLPIGGVTEQTTRSGTGIGTHASTRSRNNESIWIKADILR